MNKQNRWFALLLTGVLARHDRPRVSEAVRGDRATPFQVRRAPVSIRQNEKFYPFPAILGMIPLGTNIFWRPMAITIMGGLFVATVLTLLVVPALYALWLRVREDETKAVPDAEAQKGVHGPLRTVGVAAE
jgi:hypothetical protein